MVGRLRHRNAEMNNASRNPCAAVERSRTGKYQERNRSDRIPICASSLYLVFCFIPTAVSQREFYERLLQRIQSTPGVQEAATTTMLPASDQGLHDPFTVGLARGYDGPNVVEP
jgi:hypothetical protein